MPRYGKLIVALLVVLALSASACGDDDDAAATDGEEAAEPTEATAEDPDRGSEPADEAAGPGDDAEPADDIVLTDSFRGVTAEGGDLTNESFAAAIDQVPDHVVPGLEFACLAGGKIDARDDLWLIEFDHDQNTWVATTSPTDAETAEQKREDEGDRNT